MRRRAGADQRHRVPTTPQPFRTMRINRGRAWCLVIVVLAGAASHGGDTPVHKAARLCTAACASRCRTGARSTRRTPSSGCPARGRDNRSRGNPASVRPHRRRPLPLARRWRRKTSVSCRTSSPSRPARRWTLQRQPRQSVQPRAVSQRRVEGAHLHHAWRRPRLLQHPSGHGGLRARAAFRASRTVEPNEMLATFRVGF
jgi:hypothetical protein